MKAAAFRKMLKTEPFAPFLVKTTDGDTFRVPHPDFAIVSPVDTEVIVYDKDGHFRIVAMGHIVSLEPVQNGSRKPGKR
jgi:hypothetical protein